MGGKGISKMGMVRANGEVIVLRLRNILHNHLSDLFKKKKQKNMKQLLVFSRFIDEFG